MKAEKLDTLKHIKKYNIVIRSLKYSLSKTKKNPIWRQALLYASVQDIVKNKLIESYPQYTLEIQSLEIFCKEIKKVLEIKVVSGNFGFLTWLKTELPQVTDIFQTELSTKELLETNQTILLKCLSK